MKRWILATLAAGAGAIAIPAGVQARTCSSGYVHAIVEGEQKCLHAGEYCESDEQRTYRRYHFTCTRVNGTYRLERS